MDNSPDFIKVTPKESVYRRIAKFLLIIGVDDAAKVLSHLPQEYIEKIVPEIALVKGVNPGERNEILVEFQGLLKKNRDSGGVEKARDMLETAFGAEKAAQVLEKAVLFPDGKPFAYLQDMDGETLNLLIHDEAPATQSLILSHVPPKVAAQAIGAMEAGINTEVIRRLAKMGTVDPEAVKRVDRELYEKFCKRREPRTKVVDGKDTLEQILRSMDPGAADTLLKGLTWHDEKLAEEMRAGLFTVTDIPEVDDYLVAKELADMDDIQVAVLIAGQPEGFRAKILANVSTGRGERILEEEDIGRPFRKSDCALVMSGFLGKIRNQIDWPPII
jgi:flagellar motor switch protein FliG